MAYQVHEAQVALQNFCAQFSNNAFQKWRSPLPFHVKIYCETHNTSTSLRSNYWRNRLSKHFTEKELRL